MGANSRMVAWSEVIHPSLVYSCQLQRLGRAFLRLAEGAVLVLLLEEHIAGRASVLVRGPVIAARVVVFLFFWHFWLGLTTVRSGQIILPLGLPMHIDMQFWCTPFASVLGWTLLSPLFSRNQTSRRDHPEGPLSAISRPSSTPRHPTRCRRPPRDGGPGPRRPPSTPSLS
jgi:hypothetical protein